MKTKLIAISILWAALLIAETILGRGTPHHGTRFTLLLVCAATSLAILSAPDRCADRRQTPRIDG
ncbi:MAG: hypothetical protein NTV51_10755 [Verrucomicrobia bacterium]|nr:hypothetical protein [Verrucomicrobiota bacterium]